MANIAHLPITSCDNCPHVKIVPVYTADPWERAEKWSCTKSHNKVIDGYHEWHDKTPIPDWCPLLEKK